MKNDNDSDAAIKTLQHLGYTYTAGAELWKPPLIVAPVSQVQPADEIVPLPRELNTVIAFVKGRSKNLDPCGTYYDEAQLLDYGDKRAAAALQSHAAAPVEPVSDKVACRMQGGICACRSGGSYGGCAIERGITHQSIAALSQPAIKEAPVELTHDDLCSFLPAEFMWGEEFYPFHMKEVFGRISTKLAAPIAPAVPQTEKNEQYFRGVISALGALAPHSRHGDVMHDEIVNSVGKKALYAAAEEEDVEWAGLDPEFYASIAAPAVGNGEQK